MKKIISLILILLVLVIAPFSAFAAQVIDDIPQGGGSGTASLFGGSGTDSYNSAPPAQEFRDCNRQNAGGGALSSSFLDSILGSAGLGPVSAQCAAIQERYSSVIIEQPESEPDYAQYLACENAQRNRLLSTVGGATGLDISGILSGNPQAILGIAQRLGINIPNIGLLQGIPGLSNISGILGGGNGLLPGVNIPGVNIPRISSVAREPRVPTIDSEQVQEQKVLNEKTTVIRDNTTSIYEKECIKEPAMKTLNNQRTQQRVTETLGVTKEQIVRQPGSYYVEVSASGHEEFMKALDSAFKDLKTDDSNKAYVKEQLQRLYESNKTVGAGLRSNLQTTVQNQNQEGFGGWGDFERRMTEPRDATTIQIYVTDAYIQYQSAKNTEAKQMIARSLFEDKGTGANGCTRFKDCPGTFQIGEPGKSIESAHIDAEQKGAELDERADEVGEEVDPGFEQLALKIFQNIEGIFGLFKKNTQTGQSYMDALSGNANTSSVESAKTFITREILSAIAMEETRQSLLSEMLLDLSLTREAYNAVRVCYLTFVTSPSATVTSALATQRSNLASTTIDVVLDPQIIANANGIAISENIVEQLTQLFALGSQATTAEEINGVSDSYDALLSTGLAFNTTDLAFLEEDRAVAAAALARGRTDAQTFLAECI